MRCLGDRGDPLLHGRVPEACCGRYMSVSTHLCMSVHRYLPSKGSFKGDVDTGLGIDVDVDVALDDLET